MILFIPNFSRSNSCEPAALNKSKIQVSGFSEWLKLIDKHASENVVKILVANKCDVSGEKRVVSKERAQAQAEEFGIKCMETSALSGLNVEEVFFEMGKLALERIQLEKQEMANQRDNGININSYGDGSSKNNSSCCK